MRVKELMQALGHCDPEDIVVIEGCDCLGIAKDVQAYHEYVDEPSASRAFGKTRTLLDNVATDEGTVKAIVILRD